MLYSSGSPSCVTSARFAGHIVGIFADTSRQERRYPISRTFQRQASRQLGGVTNRRRLRTDEVSDGE